MQKTRFRLGRRGCEATLYEFTVSPAGSAASTQTHRVAAVSLEEAVRHVSKANPASQIKQILMIGLVELVSGSPLD